MVSLEVKIKNILNAVHKSSCFCFMQRSKQNVWRALSVEGTLKRKKKEIVRSIKILIYLTLKAAPLCAIACAKLERAHCSLAPKPPPNQRPRPVLVRDHNFQDKQLVMSALRERAAKDGPLKCGGATVMIFQDFSASVLRRRKRFDEVKKRLRAIGVEYSQLYPASLRVRFKGSSQKFQDPVAADQYIDSLDVSSMDMVSGLFDVPGPV